MFSCGELKKYFNSKFFQEKVLGVHLTHATLHSPQKKIKEKKNKDEGLFFFFPR